MRWRGSAKNSAPAYVDLEVGRRRYSTSPTRKSKPPSLRIDAAVDRSARPKLPKRHVQSGLVSTKFVHRKPWRLITLRENRHVSTP